MGRDNPRTLDTLCIEREAFNQLDRENANQAMVFQP